MRKEHTMLKSHLTKIYLSILLSTFVLSICFAQEKQKLREQLHNETVYPVVRILTPAGSGGSGTLIYSKDKSCEGQFESFVLTNSHVIESAVSVEMQWSSLFKKDRRVEKTQTVRVEIFIYEDTSRMVGQESFEADIKAYNVAHDLALLQLKTRKQFTNLATMLPREFAKDIYMFDPVIITGCSMLHAPLVSSGQVTSLNDEIDGKLYWMSDAQVIFGSSGGAAFTNRDNKWWFSGIPSRFRVTTWGDPITHMGCFVPVCRIYEWIDEEHLQFLYDFNKTPTECFAEREELVKKMMFVRDIELPKEEPKEEATQSTETP